MQVIIVVLLFISVIIFGVIENKKNNPGDTQALRVFKSNEIATNLMAYGDLLNQYIQVNYETLHYISPINVGFVEGVRIIDNVEVEPYNLKQLHPILNYQAMVFNYTQALLDKSVSPTLYLVITWDKVDPYFKYYHHMNLPEIAGQMNQLFSKKIYRGSGTFWTVPWILYNEQCEAKEIYSQVPTDHNNQSRVLNIANFFRTYCTQIEQISAFRFLKYVYVQPIHKAM